jgi:hypothetical protein
MDDPPSRTYAFQRTTQSPRIVKQGRSHEHSPIPTP